MGEKRRIGKNGGHAERHLQLSWANKGERKRQAISHTQIIINSNIQPAIRGSRETRPYSSVDKGVERIAIRTRFRSPAYDEGRITVRGSAK